jgi:type VI secretion system protein ImpJ
MFMRPQHFQQERRYFEHLIEARFHSANAYGWGFVNLELDHDRLASGQIALARAEAILSDGTPVVIPVEDISPIPIEVSKDISNELLYLCLPTLTSGQQEFFTQTGTGALIRYGARELAVRDNTSELANNSADIQVAQLKPELRFESQSLDGYAKIGVARVIECKSNKQVLLDDRYIPATLDAQSNITLNGFITEVYGLLKHRGEELAGRVSGNQVGTAQTADFVMLQAINRLTPQIQHLTLIRGTHPMQLYVQLLGIAGELATFASQSKRAAEYGGYDHDDLAGTFAPVMADIREALGVLLERRAVPIELQEYASANVFAGTIADSSLIANARFVLAVAADLPQDQIIQQFPTLVKLAAQEDISEIVGKQIPGIPLRVLSVAPPQIPYHTGSSYFEIETQVELWQGLNKTGALAIHLGRKFEGLRLELWAIRG